MFYIAVVKADRSLYAENYVEERGATLRYPGLTLQAMVEPSDDGSPWSVYLGEEPYECYWARVQNPPKEGEDIDEYEARLKITLQHAKDSTISKLTPTMLDDRPEWYKEGFESSQDMTRSLEEIAAEAHIVSEGKS